MRAFYDGLQSIDNIQALIDSPERENDVLEYKGAAQKFGNTEKNEISKDVSAFANSNGGVIIFGVATDPSDKTKPSAIEGVNVTNIETFDRVVNSRIQPSIQGWQKKLIPPDNPRVMVVYVPQSEDPPHQNLADKKYYRRAGTESVPMEHDLVALHFGRRLGPILSLVCQPLTSSPIFASGTEFSDPLGLRVLMRNDGRRVGKYVEALLIFPSERVTGVQIKEGRADDISRLYPGRKAFQFTENLGVFHPGMNKSILELSFSISKDFLENQSSEPLFEWRVFSDEMNSRQGHVSLSDLGWIGLGSGA